MALSRARCRSSAGGASVPAATGIGATSPIGAASSSVGGWSSTRTDRADGGESVPGGGRLPGAGGAAGRGEAFSPGTPARSRSTTGSSVDGSSLVAGPFPGGIMFPASPSPVVVIRTSATSVGEACRGAVRVEGTESTTVIGDPTPAKSVPEIGNGPAFGRGDVVTPGSIGADAGCAAPAFEFCGTITPKAGRTAGAVTVAGTLSPIVIPLPGEGASGVVLASVTGTELASGRVT